MEELDDEDGSQEDSQEEDAGSQDESQDSQDERVRSIRPVTQLCLYSGYFVSVPGGGGGGRGGAAGESQSRR